MRAIRILVGVVFLAGVCAYAAKPEKGEWWPGVSAPAKSVMISARMDGQIAKINVEEGDRVKKDQVLIQFDDELLRLSAERARIAKDDQTQVQAAQLRSEYAKREYERNKTLWEKGTIPETDFREAETQYKLSQTAVEASKMAQKTAVADYGLRVEMLDHSRVKSPIDGVVARKLVEEGESARDLMQLVEVMNVDEIRVKVNLPEEMLGSIRKGDPADVWFPAMGKTQFKGRVDKIAPVVDTRSRTFLVEVLVPNKENQMKPGLSASVRFVEHATGRPNGGEQGPTNTKPEQKVK